MLFGHLRRVSVTRLFFGLLAFAAAVILLSMFYLRPAGREWRLENNDRSDKDDVLHASVKYLQMAPAAELQPYVDPAAFFSVREIDFSSIDELEVTHLEKSETLLAAECTFASCFNVSMCAGGGLKVYVYSPSPHHHQGTPMYREILNIIRDSVYYTADPEKACLFVPGFDTLSRDDLSEHVERDVSKIFERSPDYIRWWRNGRNHLLFNFYAGTFPSYAETDILMDAGYAMLAKASISLQHMRHGFDISVPLPPDDWPVRIRDELPSRWDSNDNSANSSRKLLLSFKGKRYVHGIGSESRDTLHLLHDFDDSIVLVTTCRHGKNWQRLKDDRCDLQEQEYIRYDYEALLANSTFCLVPRGRRLGSYRFLEVLQAGCIPVVLSNEWILPFADELIDWSRALLVVDERIVFELPEYLRAFISESHSKLFSEKARPRERIVEMRKQGKLIYSAHLSSLEKIVLSVLRIIDERIAGSYPVIIRRQSTYDLRFPRSKWTSKPAAVRGAC